MVATRRKAPPTTTQESIAEPRTRDSQIVRAAINRLIAGKIVSTNTISGTATFPVLFVIEGVISATAIFRERLCSSTQRLIVAVTTDFINLLVNGVT